MGTEHHPYIPTTLGDLAFVPDGDAWICGVVDVICFNGRDGYCIVRFGDTERKASNGQALIMPKEMVLPSAGILLGMRQSVEEFQKQLLPHLNEKGRAALRR